MTQFAISVVNFFERNFSHTKPVVFMGVLLLFLVNALYASKDVIAGNLLSGSTDLMSAVFVLFCIATLMFNIVYLFESPSRKARDRQHCDFFYVIKLNLSSFASWWGYFYSLKYIEPAVAGAFIGGLIILFAWPINYFIRGQGTSNWADRFTIVAIFILGCVLMYFSLTGLSAIGKSPQPIFILKGFFGATVCGLGFAYTTIYFKNLTDLGVSSGFILSNRFYLIIVVSGGLSLSSGELVQLHFYEWLVLLGISLISIVLAQYAFVAGIRRCEPILVEAIHASLPVFTLVFQLFDPRLSVSRLSWLVVIGMTIVAVFNAIHHIQRREG